jgi:hypothetical protein
MDDCIGLPEIVEELVTKTPAFMGIRDKPRHIDDIHRNKTVTIMACTADEPELFTGACCPYVPDPEIGTDGGEWVICDLGMRKGRRFKKRGLAAVWFTC